MSPASSVSAPVRAISAVFSPTILLEISGYLMQKVRETAADFSTRQLRQVRPFDRPQQGARLLFHAQLAQARTTVVIGDGAGVLGIDRLDAQHIDQERHQFVGAVLQMGGALRPFRLVGEQLAVMLLDHAGARPAGSHHVVENLERLDHVAGDVLASALSPEL